MRDYYVQYIFDLFHVVPMYVYEGLVSVLILGLVALLLIFGYKKGIRLFTLQVLIEYLFVLFSITVFFREIQPVSHHLNDPFWSFEKMQEGGIALRAEKAMNVFAFIPIGLLFSGYRQSKWWYVILLGLFVSLLIELLQFGLNRGSADVDDVMFNTFGCIVGVGLYAIVSGVWNILKVRQ